MRACGGSGSLWVWTSGMPQTFKSPESEIAEALTGDGIEGVRRVGKTIVMTVMTVGAGKGKSGSSFWSIWG